MRPSFSFGIAVLLCFGALSSCGKKDQKVEVDFEDLRPKAGRVYEIDPDTITIPPFELKDLTPSFQEVFEVIFTEKIFFPSDVVPFPVRFGPEEYIVILEKDINERELATWYFLKFKDSVMTDNAWLNWLDCFGEDCQTLTVGTADEIKEKSGHVWTNDSLLVACIATRNGAPRIASIKKMDRFFGDSIRYSMQWGQGKPAAWRGQKVFKQ